MKLEQLRQEIDDIDHQLLRLLNERADLAVKVGRAKKQSNLAITNKERESAVLERLTKDNPGPLADEDISTIFRFIIRSCRNLQLEFAEQTIAKDV